MDMTWDLSVLYSGYDDPKYSSDYEKLLQILTFFHEIRHVLLTKL